MVGTDYLPAKKCKEVLSGSCRGGGVCYFDCMFSQFVVFFFFFFLLNGNLNLFAKWREMSRDASEEHIAA